MSVNNKYDIYIYHITSPNETSFEKQLIIKGFGENINRKIKYIKINGDDDIINNLTNEILKIKCRKNILILISSYDPIKNQIHDTKNIVNKINNFIEISQNNQINKKNKYITIYNITNYINSVIYEKILITVILFAVSV